LLAGLRKLGRDISVTGFAVAKSADELLQDVTSLTTQVAAEIGGIVVESNNVVVDGRVIGQGYGAPTQEAQQAIEMLAQSEGIFADPVYTGKGLAGLLSLVHDGQFAESDAVVFVHTGGVPALFA
jgi:1-aminocyclopropane-1-carboxylate deaminase/D-cysteine desulfhydrase-like pyridoxal-dependent ACC family enzyme